MTTILTVLIWASADRLVNETAVLEARLIPVPATSAVDSGMLVQLEGDQNRFKMTVSGPRRAVESAQVYKPLEVRLPVPDQPTGAARISIDPAALRQELGGAMAEFNRLKILDVAPEEITVSIDHLVIRDLELDAKNLSLAYDMEPQWVRNPIRVRMRESVAAEYPEGQPLRRDISADLERLLKDRPFGRNVTVSIPLDQRSFGPDAQIMPGAIEVTARVSEARTVKQVPTVPVLVALSFSNLELSVQAVDRNGAPLTLVTQTISVQGSEEEVAKLVRGETRAFGIVQLKEEDLQQLDVPKLTTPEYQLPPGVELSEPPLPIEFRLLPISKTE